uniref:Nuclear transport factor 2 like export factor 2 n=1 Tax=Cyanoderma ruficeps TaxID=181631 RepID=A0A8C3XGF9_9PASS
MISSLQDFKTYVDQACRAADEFVNIYYETMDKRRRALTRLYLDKATLVWNGNAVSGQEELNKFFEMLPSSEFQVNVLDCQPVHGTVIFKILMCRRIHPFSSSALLVISSKFLTTAVVLVLFLNGEGQTLDTPFPSFLEGSILLQVSYYDRRIITITLFFPL